MNSENSPNDMIDHYSVKVRLRLGFNPNRIAVSETPHPHAAQLLNHDSDCDRFARQFLPRSFFGGVVSICYITLGGGFENVI